MFKAIRCQSGSRAFGFRLRSEVSFFKSSIGIHKLKSNAIFQFSLKNLCGNFVLQMHSEVDCYKKYNVHTEFPGNLKLHIQQIDIMPTRVTPILTLILITILAPILMPFFPFVQVCTSTGTEYIQNIFSCSLKKPLPPKKTERN